MQSSRSASAASCSARASAAAGRYSPNRTTSGLSGAPQSQRGTPVGVGRETGADIGERVAAPQRRQDECAIVPCTSISSREPGARVQPVDVLGDHGVEQAGRARARRAPRGRGSGACPRASGSARRRSARSARDRAGRRRCARPPSGRRSPTGRSRASGSRGCPTAPRCRRRSARRPSRRADQSASQARPRRGLGGAHVALVKLRLAPLQERRDALARVPDPNTCREALLLGLDPGVEIARGRHPLDLLDRQRRLPGELARPRERGVEQLVVGHDAVDQPQLVGLDRRRSGRRSGSARAPWPRRPAAAAAACRRSRE